MNPVKVFSLGFSIMSSTFCIITLIASLIKGNIYIAIVLSLLLGLIVGTTMNNLWRDHVEEL